MSHLCLAGCNSFAAESMRYFPAGFQHLEKLDLFGCSKLRDSHLKQCFSQCYERLTHIDLGGCVQLGDEGLIQLAKKAPGLMSLRVSGARNITDVGVLELITQCVFIVQLDLSFTSISDKSVLFLVDAQPDIDELHLAGTKISDVSVAAISGKLQRLVLLTLSKCRYLTASSTDFLIQGPGTLRYLGITDCKRVTTRSVFELSKLRPECSMMDFSTMGLTQVITAHEWYADD
eukprot:GFYU01004332.1.p1 GENE.GFYU01004332.1~~GFYU01004332.1.p1  ORF type:complete len:264 (+),score=52.51 GFYU01004332.1:98-793(+)